MICLYMNEALSVRWMVVGRVPFPWSPETNGLFPIFPKNKILIFYVPCSPKLALFPCSPHFWTFVPLFPWKICPRSPVPQNPLECLINSLQSWKCIHRGEVGHFSSASKWKDGFIFSFNVEWTGLLNGTSTVASVQHTTSHLPITLMRNRNQYRI